MTITWEVSYDFTVSDQGWVATTAIPGFVIPQPLATYSPGVGWLSIWGTISGISDEYLYIELPLTAQSNLTELDSQWTFTGTGGPLATITGVFWNGIVPTSVPETPTFDNTYIPGNFFYDGVVATVTGDKVAIGCNGDAGADGNQEQKITSLTVRGINVPSGIKVPGFYRNISTVFGNGAGAGRAADISPDGLYIYIATIDTLTQPILIKISSTLTSDGTVVFEPGGGDFIGVQTGKYTNDIVYVAGQFDGTNTIEKSDDAGGSFNVIDDGSFGMIRAFEVGPDSDDRILVFDSDNGDILESIDGGVTWTTINAAVSPVINAIARSPLDVNEIVVINQGAANDSIDYSLDSGASLEDYQALPYPATDGSGVIVK